MELSVSGLLSRARAPGQSRPYRMNGITFGPRSRRTRANSSDSSFAFALRKPILKGFPKGQPKSFGALTELLPTYLVTSAPNKRERRPSYPLQFRLWTKQRH